MRASVPDGRAARLSPAVRRAAKPVSADPEALKAAQRELYEGGEYSALSSVLEPVAEALVAAAGVERGDTVLDVAAGDGNVALAAARRGAHVVATDLSPVQVERGRARCRRAGATVEWQVADAEALPFADGRFAHVLSAFGAVFAPRPAVAAAELFRVCRPGGHVGLTAWTPDGLVGESTELARRSVPAARPFPDLDLGWGVAETAREHVARHGEIVLCERRAVVWDPALRAAAGPNDCAAAFMRTRLGEEELERLAEKRRAVVGRHTGADGVVRAKYLLLVARRCGGA